LAADFIFEVYVEYIRGKCAPIINILGKSAELKWGLGHRALKGIHNGAIEPILTYGATVWEKDLTKQFVEIVGSVKTDEYQISQGIQNTVI
jgi:hypothetical protein